MLIALFLDGRYKLRELISRRVPLGDVNQAYEALLQGEVKWSVVVFDSPAASRGDPDRGHAGRGARPCHRSRADVLAMGACRHFLGRGGHGAEAAQRGVWLAPSSKANPAART